MNQNNFNLLVSLLSSEKNLVLNQFKDHNPKLAEHIAMLEVTLKVDIARKYRDNPTEAKLQLEKLLEIMPTMYASLLHTLSLTHNLVIPFKYQDLFTS